MSVKIDSASYNNAVRKLNMKVNTISKQAGMQLSKAVCDVGKGVAFEAFSQDNGGGNNGTTVSVERSKNGYRLIASGKSVCFEEFGAGVYAGEGYDGNTGSIDVSPGSYSQKYGKKQFKPGEKERWYYKGVRYVGTHPKRGMYNAAKAMKSNIKQIAKGVLTK